MRLIPRRRRRPRDAMTVVEHLEELRRRLVISVIAVAVGSVAGFLLYGRVIGFLQRPYREAVQAIGSPIRDLVFTRPVEPFVVFLKVGVFIGFLVALPVVLYQVWRFVTPGLTSRERRYAIPFVLSSLLLFAVGIAFAFAVLPRGLRFLFSFATEGLSPLLTIDEYLSFLIFLILAFGLSFELPLVLIFLSGVGIIDTAQMRQWRRYAYFGAVVFAAVVTPTQDPYTMLLMWIPLVLLYEGAILVSRLFGRRS